MTTFWKTASNNPRPSRHPLYTTSPCAMRSCLGNRCRGINSGQKTTGAEDNPRAAKGLLGWEAFLQVGRACRNAPESTVGSGTRGLANHKLGLNGDFRHVFAAAFNLVDDGLRGDLTHFHKWLPYRGQSGIGVCCAGNIVEADNGNVFRDTQARFVERPDRADGRNVVVSKECCEGMFPCQEFLGEGISNGGRRIDALELDGQFGANANAELLGHKADRVPTNGGIRTDGLTSNEGDFLVPKIAKMFEGQPRGALVVQDDVGHAIDALVPCDRDGWQSKPLRDGRVRGDEALHAARQKHLRVGLQEPGIMPVDYGEEEIIVLAQEFFNAADYHRAIGVADFFGDHANRIGSLQAQGACKKVRPVIECFCSFDDAAFCMRGNGTGGGRIVEGG